MFSPSPLSSSLHRSESAAPRAKRQCAYAECTQDGLYSAPLERSDLSKRLWLCLRHVRAYNARWNYYEGLSYEEVEQELRFATVGYRPTWPRAGEVRKEPPQQSPQPRGFPLYPQTAAQQRACQLLALTTPLEKTALKARYLELAKTLHPDKNFGTAWRKQREERLKSVTAAYRTLLSLWQKDCAKCA